MCNQTLSVVFGFIDVLGIQGSPPRPAPAPPTPLLFHQLRTGICLSPVANTVFRVALVNLEIPIVFGEVIVIVNCSALDKILKN